MIKKILLIALVIVSLSFTARQKPGVFIYIDSSEINRLDKVVEITKEIVKKNPDKEVAVYISNGSSPIVIRNKHSINTGLKKMMYISPSRPIGNDDIQRINNFFSGAKLLKGVNDSDSLRKADMEFYFILNLNQSINYDQTKNIINKLMLTNRLLIHNNLIKGCSLSVYYDTLDTYYKLDELKESYKIKNYELYGF